MDISYLLFLQSLRETLGEGFSTVMSFVTKLSDSFWPLAVLMMVYWALDRKAGRRMLGILSFGVLLNGLLKLVFCVYRPWIRDARIEPWGDAKVAATGYSFPSGHSTKAVIYYGSIGIWQRKRRLWLSVILFLLIAVTMFSRNYLGVHTPQDVLVGCAATFIVIFLTYKFEDWTDNDIRRDKTALIVGLAVLAACIAYYMLKSYPMDYNADGELLVDYTVKRRDSFVGVGLTFGYLIGRLIERRAFRYDTELSQKARLVIGVLAIIPAYFIYTYAYAVFKNLLGSYAATFTYAALLVLYVMVIVPLAMHIYARCRHIEKK